MIADALVVTTHLSVDSHGVREIIATLATGETFVARLDPPGEWTRVLGPIREPMRDERAGPASYMPPHRADGVTHQTTPAFSGGADERPNADLE